MILKSRKRWLIATFLGLIAIVMAISSVRRRRPQYLSDSDSLYAKLEEIQRGAGACNPITNGQVAKYTDVYLDSVCKLPGQQWYCEETRAFDNYLRKLPLPTRCTSAETMAAPGFFASRLDDELAKSGIANFRRPRLGTLRLSDLNARTVRVGKDDGYLVLLNPDLERVTEGVLRYFINTMSLTEEKGFLSIQFDLGLAKSRLLASPELANYFHQTLINAATGRPAITPPDMLIGIEHIPEMFATPWHQRVTETSATAAVDFVVAHEYAHALLRHREETVIPVAVPGSSGTSVDVVKRKLNQEFDADLAGFQLFEATVASNEDSPFTRTLFITGVDLFFTVAELIELQHNREGLAPIPIDPPARERRIHFHQYLNNRGVGSIAQMGDTYNAAARYAWDFANSSTASPEPK